MSQLETFGHTSPRILNVDDDAGGRRLTTAALRREGFQVIEAVTGAEALRLVNELPDLVLLDVSLPDMDGIEVCRRIRSCPRTQMIPVLHISAMRVEVEDRIAGSMAGADMYLTRPVEPSLLAATIRVLLRASLAEREARKSAAEWQTVFDSVGYGIAVLDREGCVQRANHSLSQLAGRGPEEVIGERYAHIFPTDEAPPGGWPFERARDSRERATVEIRSSGRWFEIEADPIIDEHGAFQGVVESVIDITGLKRAE